MRAHLTLALCLTVLTGCASRDEGSRTDPEVFAQHDFGALNFQALNTVAVPWKLVAAALVLDDRHGGVKQYRRVADLTDQAAQLCRCSANVECRLKPPLTQSLPRQ